MSFRVRVRVKRPSVEAMLAEVASAIQRKKRITIEQQQFAWEQVGWVVAMVFIAAVVILAFYSLSQM